MISADPRYRRRFIDVHGRRMAAVVVDGPAGRDDPVVFVHGNATPSYMRRNIMPHLEGLGRLVAIDKTGQGASDKLPDSSRAATCCPSISAISTAQSPPSASPTG
jgi:haloalkane dehalogenase